MLRVALPGLETRSEFVAALRAELPESVRIVDGDAEILVQGVPGDEDLDGRPSLKAVIIPYAGVPARTRERRGKTAGGISSRSSVSRPRRLSARSSRMSIQPTRR